MKLSSLLSRKTSSNSFIPEIDGLRFFAIITVVLFHLNTALSKEIGIGLSGAFEAMGGEKNLFSMAWWWVRFDLGVKVFFAISGFVLAMPFLRYYLGKSDKKVDIKAYFTRRLIRLEPPFIISLLIFYLVHVFILNEEWLSYLKHLVAGLIYGHILIYGEANPINPVSWSLETEAQFYLIVPLLFTLIYRWNSTWMRVIVFSSLVGLSIFAKHELIWNAHWNRSILSYFVNFSVGIVVAWVYVQHTNWIKKKGLIADMLGLMAAMGMFYFYKPQHYYENILFFNVCIFIFMVTAFKGVLFNWVFTRTWIYVIGGMCYSIYLLHYAFFHFSVKYSIDWFWQEELTYSNNLTLQVILNVTMVFIVSAVFFLSVEKPFMSRNQINNRPKNDLNI